MLLELEAGIGHRRLTLIRLLVAFHELREQHLVELQRLVVAIFLEYPLFWLQIVSFRLLL